MNAGFPKLLKTWRAKHPEKAGRFIITTFGDKSWGWAFKPNAPVLDNYVGVQSGFQSRGGALENLREFIKANADESAAPNGHAQRANEPDE